MKKPKPQWPRISWEIHVEDERGHRSKLPGETPSEDFARMTLGLLQTWHCASTFHLIKVTRQQIEAPYLDPAYLHWTQGKKTRRRA